MTRPQLRARSLAVLFDGPALTHSLAALVERLAPADVLCVTNEPQLCLGGVPTTSVRGLGALLGGAFDAVIVDLRSGLLADAIARAEGLVRGGGTLVLILGKSTQGAPLLAVHPFTPEDVGARFRGRLARAIDSPAGVLARRSGTEPLAMADRPGGGSAEQAALVDELTDVLLGPAPALVTVLADRGRGKSAALGLALARAHATRTLRVALGAGSPDALTEVVRFAGSAPVALIEPAELAAPSAPELDVIVLDEAAQLPVPLLVRIALRHPSARIVLSTTCRGYEGTGRGFVLRFLEWARTSGRPLRERTLEAPIRFGSGDPLEHFVRTLLLFDAEPGRPSASAEAEHASYERLDADRLHRDEPLLRNAFGLLVHAHYRTTPGDLERVLDAPNLSLHALTHAGAVVAVSMLAQEGGLTLPHAEALARGQGRLRGHALADTLITHAQRPDAGTLSMVRSVRIATHPERRRMGLGRRLVEAIHAEHEADLFGTIFGATAELLEFRREVGYDLVRVGVARGARSGEPSVVMVRAVTAPAHALVLDLRRELSRELPLQLELLRADGELELTPELALSLAAGLQEPLPLTPDEVQARVRRYVTSAQPSSAAPHALVEFALAHRAELALLADGERALIEARLLERRGWADVARQARLPSAAAATRALRGAVRTLLSRVA